MGYYLEFPEGEKLARRREDWTHDHMREFVICCDERGENISSHEYSEKIWRALSDGKDVVILIGGAYGFEQTVRERADFAWGFSRLVFPHMIARLVDVKQTYRAAEIIKGSSYHHE